MFTVLIFLNLLFPVQSLDCTVFFFTVSEKYSPIGFILVPGPVKALEWSPHFHVGLSSFASFCCSWTLLLMKASVSEREPTAHPVPVRPRRGGSLPRPGGPRVDQNLPAPEPAQELLQVQEHQVQNQGVETNRSPL